MVRKDVLLRSLRREHELCDHPVVAGGLVLDVTQKSLDPGIVDQIAENLLGPRTQIATDGLVDLVAPLETLAHREGLSDVRLLAVHPNAYEAAFRIANDFMEGGGQLVGVGGDDQNMNVTFDADVTRGIG